MIEALAIYGILMTVLAVAAHNRAGKVIKMYNELHYELRILRHLKDKVSEKYKKKVE